MKTLPIIASAAKQSISPRRFAPRDEAGFTRLSIGFYPRPTHRGRHQYGQFRDHLFPARQLQTQ
jgi:hypothetical protein